MPPPPEGDDDAVGTADVDLEALPSARSEPVRSPRAAHHAYDEEDDEHPCLYCYEPTTAETGIVASPCLCQGELAAQHTACLRQDLEYKMRLYCTVCKFPLQFSHRVDHHPLLRRVAAVYRQPAHVIALAITCATVGTCIAVPFFLHTAAQRFTFASHQRWFVLAAAFTVIMTISFFWAGLCDEPVMTLVLTLREPSDAAKSEWLQEGPEGHSEVRQLVPDDSDARAILTMRYEITVDLREGNYHIPPALRDVERHLHIVTATLDELMVPRLMRELSTRRAQLSNAVRRREVEVMRAQPEGSEGDGADLEAGGDSETTGEPPIMRAPSSAQAEDASLLETVEPKPPSLAREQTAPPECGHAHARLLAAEAQPMPRVSSAACALNARGSAEPGAAPSAPLSGSGRLGGVHPTAAPVRRAGTDGSALGPVPDSPELGSRLGAGPVPESVSTEALLPQAAQQPVQPRRRS